ncbi:glycosyltransferase family 2 protein [Hydrotalea sp.]|uniref:glycosyltransferase family 2 protein n=1 Tax=Hydrotalea sp. TaxID=2881279 RepID=UPI003D09D157
MPFFSIIIPSYNSGNNLIKSLESIFLQTFHDYEVWVIDGGSTDNTKQIIEAFKIENKKLFYISEKDEGIYDAMNKGIDLAKGEWLYFMGSDDVLMDSFVLEKIFNILSKSDIDYLYGNVLFKGQNIIYDGIFNIDKLLFEKNICHQSIFFKNSLFSKIGYFNLKYKLWADWDFNIRCFKSNCIKLSYCDVTIAVYNDISGQSSKNEDEIFLRELPLYYLNKIALLENKIGYYNQYIKKNRIKSIAKILLGRNIF